MKDKINLRQKSLDDFVTRQERTNMKNTAMCFLAAAMPLFAMAQDAQSPFRGHLQNDEYGVYIELNLYDNNVNVPAHELFGPLPGYLGKRNNSFYWLITAAKLHGMGKATLSLINDYGSEDLTATLTMKNDSTFTLRQDDGSTLKVPDKGKWMKLPKELELKKTRR